jgi:hypothetical protein
MVWNRAKELEQGNWGTRAVNSAVIQAAAALSAAGAAAVTTTLAWSAWPAAVASLGT